MIDQFVIVKLTYTYVCSECQKEETQSWNVAYSGVKPLPCLPTDWFEALGRIFCGDHELRVAVLPKKEGAGPAMLIPFPEQRVIPPFPEPA